MSSRLLRVGVIAALVAASFTAGAAVIGAAPSSTPSSLVPIVPCRLVDTRSGPGQVGSRAAALGAGESVTLDVWGTNGNCTIPASATAVAANVTIDRPTAASYLTVYPPDAPRPLSSNLNWTAASSPTPNQVTVALSATGSLAVYNDAGNVDVIVDVVGYYVAGSGGGAGPAGPAGPRGWSAWDVIPSGQTVTGTLVWDGHAGSGSDAVSVDLPGVAPVGLLDATVGFAPGSGTGDEDPDCTGTSAAPTAPAGRVCLYFESAPGNIDLPTMQGYEGPIQDRSFRLSWLPDNAGSDQDAYFALSWAYTAP